MSQEKVDETVPEFEKEGKLKVKKVKKWGISDGEINRILEFRRIAEIQREMEGIFLDNIAITRFAHDPKAIRLFFIDFGKKMLTIREYDPKEYEKYQLKLQEERADLEFKAKGAERIEQAKKDEESEVVSGDGQPA